MGDAAVNRVKIMILDCLPKRGDLLTLAQSQGKFRMAADSKLLSFAGPAQHSIFKTVHGWVQAMANGQAPTVEKGKANPF